MRNSPSSGLMNFTFSEYREATSSMTPTPSSICCLSPSSSTRSTGVATGSFCPCPVRAGSGGFNPVPRSQQRPSSFTFRPSFRLLTISPRAWRDLARSSTAMTSLFIQFSVSSGDILGKHGPDRCDPEVVAKTQAGGSRSSYWPRHSWGSPARGFPYVALSGSSQRGSLLSGGVAPGYFINPLRGFADSVRGAMSAPATNAIRSSLWFEVSILRPSSQTLRPVKALPWPSRE